MRRASLMILSLAIAIAVSAVSAAKEVPVQSHIVVKGLMAQAEVLVDYWGVPHIYASTPDDAVFVQGWNAARDRLWQIDMWRRSGLGDGQRVSKNDARVTAYATVDELNSANGVLLAAPPGLPEIVTLSPIEVQHELLDLGGELCIAGNRMIGATQADRLKRKMDAFNDPLPALKDVMHPGAGSAAGTSHLARAIARRAERRVWTLVAIEGDAINAEALRRSGI